MTQFKIGDKVRFKQEELGELYAAVRSKVAGSGLAARSEGGV